MPSIRDGSGYNQGYIPSKSVEVRTMRRAQYMADRMKKGGAYRTLEIGCGTGQLSFMLAKMTGNKVTGADVYAPFISEAKKEYKLKNLSYTTADFNNIKEIKSLIKKGKYDCVAGNGILHHLYYNLGNSLNNIKKILKPGGRIIFQEPNLYNPYCMLIFTLPLFRKTAKLDPREMAFTKSHILGLLNKAGYKNIRVEYRDFLVPGVPEWMIWPSIKAGDILEKVPVLKMIAQSLYIYAET